MPRAPRSSRSVAAALAIAAAAGLAACIAPPPGPGASEPAASGAGPTGAAADPARPEDGDDASASAPASEPASADPAYCGDAFVLSQLALSGWTWAGDDEQQLAAAQPVAAFHPTEAIDGVELVCSTTFRMPVDGSAGAAAYSIAIAHGGGGDAAFVLEDLAGWAAARGYLPQGEGDYVEHVRMGADGMIAATLAFRVIDDAIAAADGLALEHTGAVHDDVIVTHVDFGRS